MNTFHFGLVAITALFALMVVLFVVYSAFTYRDDTGDRMGAPIVRWMAVDLGWSLIPLFVSIGIFVWASIGFCRTVSGS